MERILVVWNQYPSLRLGQPIDNAIVTNTATSPFYLEDEKLAEVVEKYLIEHPPSKREI